MGASPRVPRPTGREGIPAVLAWRGYPLKGILDQYRQVLPNFIFSETEAIYAGRTFILIPKVLEVVQVLSSKGLCHVILLLGIISSKEISQEAVNTH